MTTTVLPHTAAAATPTGARAGFGRALWAALESIGRQRARRELLLQAEIYRTSRPELAEALRRAALG
ncbi:MAG TPA: hypothetical protein VNO84_08295 [Burkholderiaceae bacterium]|nr:hypothetical protein [Burkholderiaceae bacterium]